MWIWLLTPGFLLSHVFFIEWRTSVALRLTFPLESKINITPNQNINNYENINQEKIRKNDIDQMSPCLEGLATWRRTTVSWLWTVWESAHSRAPLASRLESTTIIILFPVNSTPLSLIFSSCSSEGTTPPPSIVMLLLLKNSAFWPTDPKESDLGFDLKHWREWTRKHPLVLDRPPTQNLPYFLPIFSANFLGCQTAS